MKAWIPAIVLAVSVWGLGGCQSKETSSSDFVSHSLQEVTPTQTTHPVSRTQAPSPTQTLHPINAPKVPPIGIVVDQNRIIIDTNQTKHFLESLTQKLDHNFKQIEKRLRKEKLQSPNDTGIIITQDRIEVDVNKTQHFVEKWMRSMEAVGQQLDGIAKELDKSFNP